MTYTEEEKAFLDALAAFEAKVPGRRLTRLEEQAFEAGWAQALAFSKSAAP